MRLGAHVSTSGGLDKAIDRGVDIGCEAIQIFVSPPQGWAFKQPPEAQMVELDRPVTALHSGSRRNLSWVILHLIG